MGEALLGALALMLVFEGLMPLLNPRGWRAVLARVIQMTDGQIRFIGLLAIIGGLVLLSIWR
jgi:uncharacterized protein YjeT (DUF2065 family)